jgi:hypothetical protein
MHQRVLRLFHRLKLTFTITLTVWVTFDVPLGDAAVRFVKLKSFDFTQQFILSINKLCVALHPFVRFQHAPFS